jgi:6-phosphogluconolactonase
MASRPCLILLTLASLISFVGCTGGGGDGTLASLNPPPGTPATVPVSTISSVVPSTANAGGAQFTITVTGESFVASSTVNWNGTSRATTEITDTQLTATITAADIAAAGAAQITVINPPPGGGTSNPIGFVINGTRSTATPGFVYVANAIFVSLTMGSMAAFSVDPNTGVLTPVPGSPFQAGAEPAGMTADLSGKFLYEVSNIPGTGVTLTNGLTAFAINQSTGALTLIPGSPFSSGIGIGSPSVDSTGKFLYASGATADPASTESIFGFSIDATTGALTPVSQAACVNPGNGAGSAGSVTADPVAALFFALDSTTSISSSGNVCAFSLNSEGALQSVTGSPYSLGTAVLMSPVEITVDSFGQFVYVANKSGAGISAFSVTPGVGALTQVQGSPFALGPTAGNDLSASLAVDPLGRFLYVLDDAYSVWGYSINRSTGVLSLLDGFPFNEPVQSTPLVVDPSGKFLFRGTQFANQPPSVSGYAIDQTTGVLTPVPGSPFPVSTSTNDGTMPQFVTVTRKVQ